MKPTIFALATVFLSSSSAGQLSKPDFEKAKAYSLICQADFEAMADSSKLRERAKAYDFQGRNLSAAERRELQLMCMAYAQGRFDGVFRRDK